MLGKQEPYLLFETRICGIEDGRESRDTCCYSCWGEITEVCSDTINTWGKFCMVHIRWAIMMQHKMSWGLCSPEQQKQCIIISEVIYKTVHKSADFVMVTYKIQLYFHAVSLPLTSVVILKKRDTDSFIAGTAVCNGCLPGSYSTVAGQKMGAHNYVSEFLNSSSWIWTFHPQRLDIPHISSNHLHTLQL